MISKRVTIALFGIVSFSLLSCAEFPTKDQDSPFFRLSEGSIIKLNQPLDVPIGKTRVFMQFGLPIAKTQLNHYYPSCNFEVRQLDTVPQKIDNDEFVVTHVQWGKEQVVRWHGVQYASKLAGDFDTGDSASIYRFYHFRLESPDQPNLKRLTCRSGLQDFVRAQLPTLSEIKKALGDIVSIAPIE